jgi:hypothetical protein
MRVNNMGDVSSDLFGYNYADAQRNRERAIAALAAMPPKPIRQMGPMDYSARNLTPETVQKFRQKECRVSRDKLALREKCLGILREMGPQTTAEMARDLKKSSRSVALALREVVNIKEEKVRVRVKYGRVADGIRWSLPAAVANEISDYIFLQHHIMTR